MHFYLLCLCYCAILVKTEYREFASVVYHRNRCTRETHGYCTRMIIITARRRVASAVLGVVILSVCPSVCHTRALWLIQRTYRRYFYTTWKCNPSSFLQPTVVGGRRPLPPKMGDRSDPPPSKIAHVDRFLPNKRNFYRFAIRSWASVARSLWATCFCSNDQATLKTTGLDPSHYSTHNFWQ